MAGALYDTKTDKEGMDRTDLLCGGHCGPKQYIGHGARRSDMAIELIVFATVFTLIVLLTGGPSNRF